MLKMLFVEPETARVLALCVAEPEVIVSTLARLEAVGQIGARAAGGGLSARAAATLKRRLDALLEMAPYRLIACPPSAIELAEKQIHFDRRAIHCRTLDRFHLGMKAALGIERLLTHDLAQARAAAALGMDVVADG